MSLESAINYVISHNVMLIEMLIGLILFTVLFLAFRYFWGAKENEENPSANMGQLEETLKKLLEKANFVSGSGMGSEEQSKLAAEIQNLKVSLEEKQTLIEQMKTQSTGATATASELSSDEKKKLDDQLKELQGKLAEYEIISEDIADLSFYKEENAKLQKELSNLKDTSLMMTQAVASKNPNAVAEPAPVEPVVGAPVVVEEIVADDLAVAAAAPAVEEPAGVTAAVDPTLNDDILAEFAQAVESQKAGNVESATKFEQPVAEKIEEAASVDLGTMDMDKMLAEASGIDEHAVGEGIVEDELEKAPDTDKLISEAAALTIEDKQLMGEFENFVKKEGTN